MTASTTSACSLLLLTLLTLLSAGACTTARPALRDLDYPGSLQKPTTLPVEAVWQQHVTATWQQPGEAEQERGFDAAVQRQGDTLTVIGLSPMGSVGFSIQQGPDGIQVQNNMPEQMAIPPRFILLDVQRTLFPWLGRDMPDGERIARMAGEEITERWHDGRIQQRTFRRLDQQPEGEITITYDWHNRDWAVPTEAVLDNGWFGYRLTIKTHSETRLSGAAAGGSR